MKSDFLKKCLSMPVIKLKNIKEYKQIPKDIKLPKMTKQQLCKLLAIIHESNKKDLLNILRILSTNTVQSLPKKFIRIVKPSKRLYHGRNVGHSSGIWKNNKDLKRIMWWAIDRVTPLVYASTSMKGMSLDPFHRWDIYEAHMKKNTSLLFISKQSIEYILDTPEISNLQCEGKTVGKWLRKAFPIIRGKLKRRSYIESDRKMAICLCNHIGCCGYIANEIPVVNGPGALHKEILICIPSESLKLHKYISFTTKKGRLSVEKYLNKKTTKLSPDKVILY